MLTSLKHDDPEHMWQALQILVGLLQRAYQNLRSATYETRSLSIGQKLLKQIQNQMSISSVKEKLLQTSHFHPQLMTILQEWIRDLTLLPSEATGSLWILARDVAEELLQKIPGRGISIGGWHWFIRKIAQVIQWLLRIDHLTVNTVDETWTKQHLEFLVSQNDRDEAVDKALELLHYSISEPFQQYLKDFVKRYETPVAQRLPLEYQDQKIQELSARQVSPRDVASIWQEESVRRSQWSPDRFAVMSAVVEKQVPHQNPFQWKLSDMVVNSSFSDRMAHYHPSVFDMSSPGSKIVTSKDTKTTSNQVRAENGMDSFTEEQKAFMRDAQRTMPEGLLARLCRKWKLFDVVNYVNGKTSELRKLMAWIYLIKVFFSIICYWYNKPSYVKNLLSWMQSLTSFAGIYALIGSSIASAVPVIFVLVGLMVAYMLCQALYKVDFIKKMVDWFHQTLFAGFTTEEIESVLRMATNVFLIIDLFAFLLMMVTGIDWYEQASILYTFHRAVNYLNHGLGWDTPPQTQAILTLNKSQMEQVLNGWDGKDQHKLLLMLKSMTASGQGRQESRAYQSIRLRKHLSLRGPGRYMMSTAGTSNPTLTVSGKLASMLTYLQTKWEHSKELNPETQQKLEYWKKFIESQAIYEGAHAKPISIDSDFINFMSRYGLTSLGDFMKTAKNLTYTNPSLDVDRFFMDISDRANTAMHRFFMQFENYRNNFFHMEKLFYYRLAKDLHDNGGVDLSGVLNRMKNVHTEPDTIASITFTTLNNIYKALSTTNDVVPTDPSRLIVLQTIYPIVEKMNLSDTHQRKIRPLLEKLRPYIATQFDPAEFSSFLRDTFREYSNEVVSNNVGKDNNNDDDDRLQEEQLEKDGQQWENDHYKLLFGRSREEEDVDYQRKEAADQRHQEKRKQEKEKEARQRTEYEEKEKAEQRYKQAQQTASTTTTTTATTTTTTTTAESQKLTPARRLLQEVERLKKTDTRFGTLKALTGLESEAHFEAQHHSNTLPALLNSENIGTKDAAMMYRNGPIWKEIQHAVEIVTKNVETCASVPVRAVEFLKFLDLSARSPFHQFLLQFTEYRQAFEKLEMQVASTLKENYNFDWDSKPLWTLDKDLLRWFGDFMRDIDKYHVAHKLNLVSLAYHLASKSAKTTTPNGIVRKQLERARLLLEKHEIPQYETAVANFLDTTLADLVSDPKIMENLETWMINEIGSRVHNVVEKQYYSNAIKHVLLAMSNQLSAGLVRDSNDAQNLLNQLKNNIPGFLKAVSLVPSNLQPKLIQTVETIQEKIFSKVHYKFPKMDLEPYRFSIHDLQRTADEQLQKQKKIEEQQQKKKEQGEQLQKRKQEEHMKAEEQQQKRKEQKEKEKAKADEQQKKNKKQEEHAAQTKTARSSHTRTTMSQDESYFAYLLDELEKLPIPISMQLGWDENEANRARLLSAMTSFRDRLPEEVRNKYEQRWKDMSQLQQQVLSKDEVMRIWDKIKRNESNDMNDVETAYRKLMELFPKNKAFAVSVKNELTKMIQQRVGKAQPEKPANNGTNSTDSSEPQQQQQHHKPQNDGRTFITNASLVAKTEIMQAYEQMRKQPNPDFTYLMEMADQRVFGDHDFLNQLRAQIIKENIASVSDDFIQDFYRRTTHSKYTSLLQDVLSTVSKQRSLPNFDVATTSKPNQTQPVHVEHSQQHQTSRPVHEQQPRQHVHAVQTIHEIANFKPTEFFTTKDLEKWMLKELNAHISDDITKQEYSDAIRNVLHTLSWTIYTRKAKTDAQVEDALEIWEKSFPRFLAALEYMPEQFRPQLLNILDHIKLDTIKYVQHFFKNIDTSKYNPSVSIEHAAPKHTIQRVHQPHVRVEQPFNFANNGTDSTDHQPQQPNHTFHATTVTPPHTDHYFNQLLHDVENGLYAVDTSSPEMTPAELQLLANINTLLRVPVPASQNLDPKWIKLRNRLATKQEFSQQYQMFLQGRLPHGVTPTSLSQLAESVFQDQPGLRKYVVDTISRHSHHERARHLVQETATSQQVNQFLTDTNPQQYPHLKDVHEYVKTWDKQNPLLGPIHPEHDAARVFQAIQTQISAIDLNDPSKLDLATTNTGELLNNIHAFDTIYHQSLSTSASTNEWQTRWQQVEQWKQQVEAAMGSMTIPINGKWVSLFQVIQDITRVKQWGLNNVEFVTESFQFLPHSADQFRKCIAVIESARKMVEQTFSETMRFSPVTVGDWKRHLKNQQSHQQTNIPVHLTDLISTFSVTDNAAPSWELVLEQLNDHMVLYLPDPEFGTETREGVLRVYSQHLHTLNRMVQLLHVETETPPWWRINSDTLCQRLALTNVNMMSALPYLCDQLERSSVSFKICQSAVTAHQVLNASHSAIDWLIRTGSGATLRGVKWMLTFIDR